MVAKGTAKAAGLRAGAYGKTGTAEYGSGAEAAARAWFHGCRGDVAFADRRRRAAEAAARWPAPVAADFLRGF